MTARKTPKRVRVIVVEVKPGVVPGEYTAVLVSGRAVVRPGSQVGGGAREITGAFAGMRKRP